MIASILANAIAHLVHLDQELVGEATPKMTRPPPHAMLVWKCIFTAGSSLTQLLIHPNEAWRTWDHVASTLMHGGQDVNWKPKPSPMDQVKGRTAGGIPWTDKEG